MSVKKLSIIIVTHNSHEYLEKCLESLNFLKQELSFEIIVVDNASRENSGGAIDAKGLDITWVKNQINYGFSHAVNQALRMVKTEYCLWLNPDSELLNAGVAEMITYMDQNPKVGILGPKIQNPDGGIQFSCRTFPNHLTALFNRYSILTRLFPKNHFTKNYLHTDWDRAIVHDVDWVSGACLLMRSELLHGVGFLDERFFMYCEDVDYCFRAKRLGWNIQYHPAATILHHIGGSSRKLRSRMIIERHKSMWRYYEKHYSRNFFLDVVTAVGILARCLFVLFSDFIGLLRG